MKCPCCREEFWALYLAPSGRHVCMSCKNSRPDCILADKRFKHRTKPSPAPRIAKARADGKMYSLRMRGMLNLCLHCEAPAEYLGEVLGFRSLCPECYQRSKANDAAVQRSVDSSPSCTSPQ